MPCGVQLIKNIPSNIIDGVTDVAKAENPKRIYKESDGSNGWNLTLVFDPCPDGSDPITSSVQGDATPPHVVGSARTNPDQFIQLHLDDARAVKTQSNVPIAVCLAQSAQETGWGRSVKGNVYFGIKAQEGKESITFMTHETDPKTRSRILTSAAFTSYANFRESALDYGHFLTSNKRYRLAFQHTDDPEAFARAVAAAGFATDPDYGDKLVSIIRNHRLTLLT